MLNIKKIILLTAISLTIAACGSTPYKKTNWTNSVAESDWDIDSAICLHKSQKLNNDDLKRVNQIRLKSDQMNQALQHNATQQSGGSDAANSVISALGVLGAMFAESAKATAEDTVKDENFNRCLKSKGWDKK